MHMGWCQTVRVVQGMEEAQRNGRHVNFFSCLSVLLYKRGMALA
jgi:hypothetical protein